MNLRVLFLTMRFLRRGVDFTIILFPIIIKILNQTFIALLITEPILIAVHYWRFGICIESEMKKYLSYVLGIAIVVYYYYIVRMATITNKHSDIFDKENTKVGGPQLTKKDKLLEEVQPKKTILGETNQHIIVVPEPSSPEDARLLNRKREMQQKSVGGFSLKLNLC